MPQKHEDTKIHKIKIIKGRNFSGILSFSALVAKMNLAVNDCQI